MAKLKMLKSGPAMLKGGEMKVIHSDSWRDGKTTTQRGYGHKWQKARVTFLRSHPLCSYCERRGRVELATVVDHKVPHRGDQSLFWNKANWQSLCASCHSAIKQKEEAETR